MLLRKAANLGKIAAKRRIDPETFRVYREHREKKEKEIDQSVLFIVFDSCRYDSFMQAYDNEFPDDPKKVYSPACWTIPSHQAYVRGTLPMPATPEDVRPQLPNDYRGLHCPIPLQHAYSFGSAAMPLLDYNSVTENKFSEYFDDWFCGGDDQCAERVTNHALEWIMDTDEEFYGLINYGETHYPYQQDHWNDRHEVLEDLRNISRTKQDIIGYQAEACRKLFDHVSRLQNAVPDRTHIVVTADHGELLGESGGYLHNPSGNAVFDRKLFEVPYLSWEKKKGSGEGVVRRA